jgi:acetyl esterase/lipase
VDIAALTDDAHRQVLEFLPPNLFDFSDLAAGVSKLEAMLGGAPAELPEGVRVIDRTVEAGDGHPITVRLYEPVTVTTGGPALYWMHGGGLVMGSVALDDAPCAATALELGIVVASVEYRTAPAFPFPTPLDDCVAGFEWLVEHAASLGIDPTRVAVGGNSAGAGLAAALTLRQRDLDRVAPCFQLLRYPMLDDRNVTASSRAITDGRVWNRGANVASWHAYLGDLGRTDDVPVYAAASRATDLAGLPPAIITVGGLDMFLDEDIAYAQALMAGGVSTELHVYPAAFHGSNVMVPHAAASLQMQRDEMSALARALGI